jgi:hypothetical protein
VLATLRADRSLVAELKNLREPEAGVADHAPLATRNGLAKRRVGHVEPELLGHRGEGSARWSRTGGEGSCFIERFLESFIEGHSARIGVVDPAEEVVGGKRAGTGTVHRGLEVAHIQGEVCLDAP